MVPAGCKITVIVLQHLSSKFGPNFSTHVQNNKEDPLLSKILLEGKVGLRPEEIIGIAMTFGQSHW